MKKSQTRASTADVRVAAVAKASAEQYQLCLFIAGTTPGSSAALATVIAVCEERLAERYDLVVIDVYQEPARAKAEQIIAVPTLLKKKPLPVKRLIGDLSDRKQLLIGLGLPPEPPKRHEEKER